MLGTLPNTDQERLWFEAELRHRWALWRRKEQWVADDDKWVSWVYLAGRGAGKTRSGAEKVREWAEKGVYQLGHLIAPTSADVRDTMVEGPAGILSVCSPEYMPTYEPSIRRLTWPKHANGRPGTIVLLFSADEPDRLRGPQCQFLWADEPCAWRRPRAWDMAMFGLRLPPYPRSIVTTTPRPIKLLKELMQAKGTIVTRGTTYDNRANLAAVIR